MLESITYQLGALTTYGSSQWPKKFGSKIAAFSLLMFGFLTWNMWEAMLVSYLSVRKITLPFESIEELMSATTFNILIYFGGFFEDTFKYSKEAILQQVYNERILPLKSKYGNITSTRVLVDFVANKSDLAVYSSMNYVQ